MNLFLSTSTRNDCRTMFAAMHQGFVRWRLSAQVMSKHLCNWLWSRGAPPAKVFYVAFVLMDLLLFVFLDLGFWFDLRSILVSWFLLMGCDGLCESKGPFAIVAIVEPHCFLQIHGRKKPPCKPKHAEKT